MRRRQPRPESDPRQLALRLLARREHSRHELRDKLRSRGLDPGLIDPVLDDLSRSGLLSDARFVDSYVYARRQRGFGPRRIEAELRERGVADDLIDAGLGAWDADWRPVLEGLYARRYGSQPATEGAERARRLRFLTGRGFSAALAQEVMDGAGN